MAFIPVPNVAKVAIVGGYAFQEVVNTLYFEASAGWGLGDLHNLCEAVHDWWSLNLPDELSQDFGLFEIQAYSLESDSAPSFVLAVTPTEYGLVAGQGCPTNAALVVSFRTDLRGRSYRGRNYLSGIPVSRVQSETDVNATMQAGALSAYEGLAAVETTMSCNHVVVSREHNGVKLSTGVATVVTSYTCDSKLDSQRRRLSGRGI